MDIESQISFGAQNSQKPAQPTSILKIPRENNQTPDLKTQA